MPISCYSSFVPTIVTRIESKVITDSLVVFMSFISSHIFEGIAVVLLICFQIDSISPRVSTIVFIHTKSMLVIIVTRYLMSRFLFWGRSEASKFVFTL